VNLTLLNQTVLALDDAPTDTLLDYGGRIDAAKALLKEISQRWEAAMVSRIERDGPIEVGPIRYYAGPDKDTKCVDVRATTEACMDAAQGDVDAYTSVLSSNAYKPGACRKLLPPEKFDALFVTTERVVLKEGKPAKQLQKVNTSFLK
jgi:hypothetical protein